MKRNFAILFSLLFCGYLFAEDYCQYDYLNGKKGNEIRKALYEKLKDHTVLGYGQVWANVTGADDRGDGTNNIWDMYSNCVFSKYDKCGSGDSKSDCECYNREHSLPKSWWGGSEDEPMYTDLHHLIPTDRLANSQRAAWPLGEVDSVLWTNGSAKLGYGIFGSNSSNMTFEPADEYKGDFARIYFYMATCYMNKSFTQNRYGGKIFKAGTADLNQTALNLYLEWHRKDPVSQKEIDRNNKVEKKQGNRNPFVDDPEMAEYIWGKKKNVAYSCAADRGIEDIHVSEPAAQKIWMDGVLYIVRGEHIYTIQGVPVR